MNDEEIEKNEGELAKIAADLAQREYDLGFKIAENFHNRAGIVLTVFIATLVVFIPSLEINEIIKIILNESRPAWQTYLIVIEIFMLFILLGLTCSCIWKMLKAMSGGERSLIDSEFINDYESYSIISYLKVYVIHCLDCTEDNHKKNKKMTYELLSGINYLALSFCLILVISLINQFILGGN